MMVCMLMDKNSLKSTLYGALMAWKGDKRMEKILEPKWVGLG